MQNYITAIEELWQIRDSISEQNQLYVNAKKLIDEIIQQLSDGKITVCTKDNVGWQVNEWVKKAILLNFKVSTILT